jgi:hypothetical protein
MSALCRYAADEKIESTFRAALFLALSMCLSGAAAAAVPGAAVSKPDAASSAAPLAWRRDATAVALMAGTQIVWQFHYGSDSLKPYFHPIAPVGGPVLTVNEPGDHAHHHGLWFSWHFIDGVDYYHEDPKVVPIIGVTAWSAPQIRTDSHFGARLTQDLSYHRPGASPVLKERRTIAISPPAPDGSYFMDWDMRFTPIQGDVILDRPPLPGEPDGTPWGGYAGLSVHFMETMNSSRVITENGRIDFTEINPKFSTYRGRGMGMDFSGRFPETEAGIAILDAPANLNSPSPWYAIDNWYFSPAVIQYGKHIISSGTSLHLRYRVIVHSGMLSIQELRQAIETWHRETEAGIKPQ